MNKSMMLKTLALSTLMLTACDKSTDSFSLLSDSNTFKQGTAYIPRKIDILWVIDNSGSMANSQQSLANNFQSFIQRFSAGNYDFQMGVITTEAYLHAHYNQPARSRLRDGHPNSPSGFRILTPTTPNLEQVFINNIMQGTGGSGDERAFSSFYMALPNSLNNGFLRPGAFLSIIIVSDEDDFSHDDAANGTSSYYATTNYNDPKMYSIPYFTNFLDNLTQSQPGGIRNYSVSTISIQDSNCLTQLNINGQKMGLRYKDISLATGGTIGSLCDNFGQTLSTITDKVLELSSSFVLDREPYISSIVVTVDGLNISQSGTNGWTYDPATQAVTFHGNAIPPAGADVRIYFDPVNVKI